MTTLRFNSELSGLCQRYGLDLQPDRIGDIADDLGCGVEKRADDERFAHLILEQTGLSLAQMRQIRTNFQGDFVLLVRANTGLQTPLTTQALINLYPPLPSVFKRVQARNMAFKN